MYYDEFWFIPISLQPAQVRMDGFLISQQTLQFNLYIAGLTTYSSCAPPFFHKISTQIIPDYIQQCHSMCSMHTLRNGGERRMLALQL